jgi:polyphosphate kinase 2 (PPK2 family)
LLLSHPEAEAQRSGRIKAPLPAISTGAAAKKVRKSDKRIERFRQHYLARARGGAPAVSLKKQAREARFVRDARKVNKSIKSNPDKRPVLIILEGPDGAGKSGTIRRLQHVFEGVGTMRQVHFGAPPKNEKGHWLTSYKKELPKKGEVMIWDRSYMGRVVYDPYYKMADKKLVKQRYGEIEKLEGELSSQVRIVKIYLDARGDRLAQTIGKREAQAPEKLAESDYRSFKDRKVIRQLFKSAIKNTGGKRPWHVVPMTDRAEGRDAMLKILSVELGGKPSAALLLVPSVWAHAA